MITKFGTAWPATKLRFDGAGREPPSSGYAVTYPFAVAAVAVTFITIADPPGCGTPLTPPVPVTCNANECAGPIGPNVPPVPLRVSNTRNGVTGVNSPSA